MRVWIMGTKGYLYSKDSEVRTKDDSDPWLWGVDGRKLNMG